MILWQTLVLPEAVPPATPMMNGRTGEAFLQAFCPKNFA